MEEKKEFFDFTSDKAFNLNEEYIKYFGNEEIIKDNKSEMELRDAEKIISEDGLKYMEYTSINKYERIFMNINEFFKKYRTDSEEVKAMTTSDRDKLFGYGKELFKEYKLALENLAFNFEMSIKEWNFLEHTITKKLSYTGNDLFTYWELYVKFIEPTKLSVKDLPKEIPNFVPTIPIRSLVLLQHLLFRHEEKGSTESFNHYRNLCFEIAKMTKLFNAYGVMLSRTENRFTHWVHALNAMDGFNADTISNREPDTEEIPEDGQ